MALAVSRVTSGRSAILSAAFSNSAKLESWRDGHPLNQTRKQRRPYEAIGAEESVDLELLRLKRGQRGENADRIKQYPAIVLDLITRQKSVFDEGDVTRTLHRYIDDASPFQDLLARVLQSPEILQLDRERTELGTGVRLPVKYKLGPPSAHQPLCAPPVSGVLHDAAPTVTRDYLGSQKVSGDEA